MMCFDLRKVKCLFWSVLRALSDDYFIAFEGFVIHSALGLLPGSLSCYVVVI